jgi:hypothetical protein
MAYNALPKQKQLPIVLIYFDGVIHDCMEGWQDGKIYGKPVEWFFDWAVEAKKYFKLAIYSSRSAESHKGIKPMQDWLAVHLQAWKWDNEKTLTADQLNLRVYDFEFPTQKPAAFVTIDDRCICFNGNWKDPALQPMNIKNFKPWNMRK